MVDKLLIMNVSAQKQKYGSRGFRKVRAAIGKLVATDWSRGLKTRVVDISNPKQMKRYGATTVSRRLSEAQNKDAVDRVYAAVQPHYLLLIDGPDIIPHILLKNPVPDEDENIPSDLPYASDKPYIDKNAATYAAVTRVVGRIPGVTGTNDPAFLVSQIKTAAVFRSRRREEYLSYFAISGHAWRKSTEQSVDRVFRKAAIRTSPPAESPKTRRMLAPLTHFINCDGAKESPNFYGKRSKQKVVVSMTSDDVTRGASRGTIVAAESCFGAQLFAPAVADGKLPIANAYLNAGAIGFFGSTTIAYGSSERNGGADLMTQYFLGEVLDNASLGRACLQARQKFVYSQKMESPVNLKTLAQFILLGDPSLQPVRGASEIDELSGYVDVREARRTRRIALAASGKSVEGCSGFPGREIRGGNIKLRKVVHKIARQKGFAVALDAVQAYEVIGRGNYARAMGAREQGVIVATHREKCAGKTPKGVQFTRVLVAHTQDGNLTGVFEYVRR